MSSPKHAVHSNEIVSLSFPPIHFVAFRHIYGNVQLFVVVVVDDIIWHSIWHFFHNASNSSFDHCIRLNLPLHFVFFAFLFVSHPNLLQKIEIAHHFAKNIEWINLWSQWLSIRSRSASAQSIGGRMVNILRRNGQIVGRQWLYLWDSMIILLLNY